MSSSAHRPVRISIVNDYEIVVAGIAAVLEPYRDRVEVVELDANTPLVSEVDVVLYDTFGQPQGDRVDLAELVQESSARVVIYSWNVESVLVDDSLAHGVAGYVSKGCTAVELVEALEAIHAGQRVVPPPSGDLPADDQLGRWPGREHGLSAREAEVLALIVQGLSNQEIAQRAYLGVNTVKTYVRTAYRKLGITRRAQAVRWGIEHGFGPDRVRHLVRETVPD